MVDCKNLTKERKQTRNIKNKINKNRFRRNKEWKNFYTRKFGH